MIAMNSDWQASAGEHKVIWCYYKQINIKKSLLVSCNLFLMKSYLGIADKCSWLQRNLKTFQLHHFNNDRVLDGITNSLGNIIATPRFNVSSC